MKGFYQGLLVIDVGRRTCEIDGLPEDLLRTTAANVNDTARRFNLREGLQPADDRLPLRFIREPLPETGQVITEQQFEQLLREYYLARGWSPQGLPPGESISSIVTDGDSS